MFYQNKCMLAIADGTKFKRIVRSVLLVILISISINSHATNYYIAASGDDSNSGISSASPWKTLNKLNSFFRSLQPGDKVLFNKGDVFYGNIVISQSGSLDNPIIISSYGTGTNPVITGFTNVTSWTNLGGNIWESNNTLGTIASSNMVAINGINTAKGRTPNENSYYNITSFASTSPYSITTTSALINWAGADVIVRKGMPGENKGLVNSVTGGTVNWTDYITQGPVQSAGFGFFFNNDIRTLDVQNEWYYNPVNHKLDIYSVGAPTATVEVATVDNVINNAGFDYITIDGLNITGAGFDLISYTGITDSVKFLNCTLQYCGDIGIKTNGGSAIVKNCTIKDVGKSGTELTGSYSYLGYNNVLNAGIVHGQSNWGIRNNGLYTVTTNSVIEYNTIKNCGTDGIAAACSFYTVQYNRVDSTLLANTDNGGIYIGGSSRVYGIIDHNIVSNAVGYLLGTPHANDNPGGFNAVGIYIDEGVRHVTVTNNTAFNCGEDGFKLHSYTGSGHLNSDSNRIENNTFYNNGVNQILIQNNNSGLPMFADTFRYNINFSKSATQWALNVNDQNNNIAGLGVIDYNFYVRPMDNGNIIQIQTTNTSPGNLSAWQSLSSFDAHSVVTPKTITNTNNLLFKYNATSAPVNINLNTTNYVDALGKIYKDSVTLNPYSSIILIKQAP